MGNWVTVFEDHFDGCEINNSVWQYEIGFIRNNEPQYYTDRKENSYTENSDLVIVTRREEYEGAPYTSASLNTKGTKEFKYGLFEMRAKLPHGKGIWPAFWTLGADIGECGWPLCGEIDIMEAISDIKEENDRRIFTTLHWKSRANGQHDRDQGIFFFENEKYYDDYHTYAIDWNKDRVIWLIDGKERYRVDIKDDMQGSFDKPHYILVNTAFANWSDDSRPDETTQLPQEYRIDYIRVSQWKE